MWRERERERGRRKYMHVRIVTTGIRKWGGGEGVPKGTFVAEIVMRVFMARGLYVSGFPPCVPPPFCCSFARSSHEAHMSTGTSSPSPFTEKKNSLASRSGRVSDCVITGSHTEAESAGRSLRPPSVQWETFLIIFHSARLSYKSRLRLLSAATIVRFIISARKSLMNLISYFTTGK